MKKYFEKSTFVSRVHNKQHDGHSRSGTIQCNKSVELLNIIHKRLTHKNVHDFSTRLR